MSLTYAEARDEMLKQLTDAWVAHDSTLPMLYDDRPEDIPGDGTAWARCHIQHNAGDQDTLAGPIGNRLFGRDGLIMVQIFAPIGKGLSKADELAKVVADAFEGQSTPGGVWFRKVRLREVGPDKAWYQVNVVAEFNYVEAK